MINPNFNTRAINKIANYNFFVDEYQRGYKWTARQVIDLLEDINNFDKTQEVFYCLQPLAVKTMPEDKAKRYFSDHVENSYEVIDGQQRLTTILLILKVLNKQLYRIEYQTRKTSADFLRDIKTKVGNTKVDYSDSISALTNKIIAKWKEQFDGTDNNNIDNYHFFNAYLCIKAWFANKDADSKDEFSDKLLNYTRFIWYKDDSADDAKVVFRNLNSGKIGLTNAELIKALFINSFKNGNKEIQELKQNTFAGEWDQIEQTLQDDDFWFFINNDTSKERYQTRIDFLFEIVLDKPANEKDKLYTYRQYANNKDVQLDWKIVKHHFLKLKEWYNHPRWYHLIGFIIDRKFATINHLIKFSKPGDNKNGISKTDFEQELYNIIRKKFNAANGDGIARYDLDSITFDTNYEEVKSVLLLFNIEQYLRNIPGVRFPFKAFKKTKWTIEHVHAQNADDIKSIAELKAWIKDVQNIYTELVGRKKELEKDKNKNQEEITLLEEKIETFKNRIQAQLDNIAELAKEKKEEAEITTELRREMVELMPFTKEFMDVHKLGNLALLDGPTNSGLGKKSFPLKRDYIVEVDKKTWDNNSNSQQRPYIPPATINVFLKYYTREVKQYEFWGYKDRCDYLNEIKEVLKPYFETEEVAS